MDQCQCIFSVHCLSKIVRFVVHVYFVFHIFSKNLINNFYKIRTRKYDRIRLTYDIIILILYLLNVLGIFCNCGIVKLMCIIVYKMSHI